MKGGRMNKTEQEFASMLESQNKLYFEQPKKFKLPMPHKSYRPDFYVVEDGTFYEVAGTRQAYSYNREKYKVFQQVYPWLKFKVVNPDGTDYQHRKPRVTKVKQPHETRNISLPLMNMRDRENKTKVQTLLINFIIKNGLSIKSFSREYNMVETTVGMYLRAIKPKDPKWIKNSSLEL